MILPLFGFGQTGKSKTTTAERHLNLYAEIRPNTEKPLAFYGTPGFTLRVAFGDTPVRGWIAVNNLYYVVHRGTFYEVNNAGVKVARGTISTSSGRVDMAYDGAVVLLVTGAKGYTYTVATTTLAEVVAPGFPDGANTCAWLDGFFIVDNGINDQFQISPDGTNWNVLDFSSAESQPDGIVRVFTDNGELILLGSDTTEFRGNVGAIDEPFQTIKGATQEFGLAARWSLTKFNSGVAALMKSKDGQVQVCFFKGYVPMPISSQELDSIINGYAAVADATAYAYKLGGHPMLQINFPTAGTSWLYDASTSMWSPLEYGLDGARHRGEMHLDFLNKPLIADFENGNIYELDADVLTDNGTAIARELIGKHFFKDGDRQPIAELFVDMETGVGLVSGQGSNPQAMLQISKDGGHTWGNELWTSIGAIGKYMARVAWRRLGIARSWTFKVRISDPIKVVITYAAVKF